MAKPREEPAPAPTGDTSETVTSSGGSEQGRRTRRRRSATGPTAEQIRAEQIHTLLSRGHAAIEAGNWDCAIEEFSAAVDLAPDDVNARMYRSIAHVQRGRDYEFAIADVDVALAHMTDPAQRKRAYECRAAAHTRADQLEAALCDCEAGLALDPDDPALRRSRARLLVLLGRCDEAVQCLTSALALHRGDLDSLYVRAAAYAGGGNVAAARQDIIRACGLEAAHRITDAGCRIPRAGHDLQAQMAVMWATLLARPGQRITAYGTALSTEGEDTAGLAAALLNRAAVYLMLGQNERRALSDLDDAARLEPTCMAVLMTRALVNSVLDRYEEAFEDAATAISGQPERPDDEFVLAVGRARRGEDLAAVLSYLDGAIEPQAQRA